MSISSDSQRHIIISQYMSSHSIQGQGQVF